MRKPQFIGILAIILFTLVLSATVARAQPALSTVFTYQGSLTDNGTPANGLYDFRFRLLDAPTGGSQVGPVLTRDDLVVQQGLFVTALDFGAVFNGSPRYLEISVRPGASTGELTVLSPRQEFTAAPMALFSGTSRVSESALALQGRPIGSVAPATGQVLKWNGSQWLPNSDDNTTYTAGQGLSLTSNRFEVRFAGSGSSTSAARSDHNHFGQNWTGNVGFTALWIQNNSTASGAAGLVGISVNSAGLDGRSTSGAGLRGVSTTGYGVWANGGTGRGVETRGDAYGVFASSSTIGGRGVEAQAGQIAIFGIATNAAGRAGEFQGAVAIFGRLTKSSGSFLIDHPLDPANKYLSHSFVESPDMLNIYNGNVTLDANGEALVRLPNYFEVLNIDYRYQLTALGAPGPNLYIAEEIQGNQFKIAGGTPGGRVSWQITGIRNDLYARENRIVVEQDKPEDERGTYIYPPGSGTGDTPQDTSSSPLIIRGPSTPSQPTSFESPDAAMPTQP